MDTIYSDGTYLRNNPDWHVDDSPWKAKHIAAMLERHGIVPTTVCEIGCGAGEILRALSTHLEPSARFFGYEISLRVRALLGEVEPGFTFRLANLLDDRAADVVMAITSSSTWGLLRVPAQARGRGSTRSSTSRSSSRRSRSCAAGRSSMRAEAWGTSTTSRRKPRWRH
jgi:hypothetical protein